MTTTPETMPSWHQLPLDIRWHGVYALEQFVVAGNGSTLARLDQLLAGNHPMPAYLFGPSGCGKTHLLQAACRALGEIGRPVAYVSGHSLRLHPERLDGLDAMALVAVDDVDALAGADAAQQALFHLYNRSLERPMRLLVAGCPAPARLRLERDDLRTRLCWGSLLRLTPLDETGLMIALKARARSRGLDLPDDAAAFLLRTLPRDAKVLFAALDQLDRAALAAKRRLTVPFIRAGLQGATVAVPGPGSL